MKNIQLICLFCCFFGAALADDLMLDTDAIEAGTVRDGVHSSGQPDADQVKRLAAAGFEAVIDLRGPDEPRGFDAAAAVEASGMDYVSLPIAGPGDVNADAARTLDDILGRYQGPVLVHCASGNRVGALLALRAHAKGASAEEALAIGRSAGLTRLESTVKDRLNEAKSPANEESGT